MIGLLISVLVVALICYLVFWVLTYLGAPEPVRKVAVVVMVVLAVVYLLSALGGWGPGFVVVRP